MEAITLTWATDTEATMIHGIPTMAGEATMDTEATMAGEDAIAAIIPIMEVPTGPDIAMDTGTADTEATTCTEGWTAGTIMAIQDRPR